MAIFNSYVSLPEGTTNPVVFTHHRPPKSPKLQLGNGSNLEYQIWMVQQCNGTSPHPVSQEKYLYIPLKKNPIIPSSLIGIPNRPINRRSAVLFHICDRQIPQNPL